MSVQNETAKQLNREYSEWRTARLFGAFQAASTPPVPHRSPNLTESPRIISFFSGFQDSPIHLFFLTTK